MRLMQVLIFPALLHRLSDALDVLSSVVLVEVGRFDVGRRGRVWIVQETLYAGQDGGHIVRRTPSILENVETKLARAVDVWVEHLADELDARWPVRVLLLELHHQPEGAVFEGSVCWADDHGIPRHDIIRYRGG